MNNNPNGVKSYGTMGFFKTLFMSKEELDQFRKDKLAIGCGHLTKAENRNFREKYKDFLSNEKLYTLVGVVEGINKRIEFVPGVNLFTDEVKVFALNDDLRSYSLLILSRNEFRNLPRFSSFPVMYYFIRAKSYLTK